jgi:hypothetical protein
VLSDDGRFLTADFTNPALAGHDWQQGLAMNSGADPYAGFWFDGYSSPNPPVAPPTSGTAPPSGGTGQGADVGMTINGGAQYTNSPDVTLSVIAPSGVDNLRVANDGGSAPPRVSASPARSSGSSRSPAPSACPRPSTCASGPRPRRSRTTSSSTRPSRP